MILSISIQLELLLISCSASSSFVLYFIWIKLTKFSSSSFFEKKKLFLSRWRWKTQEKSYISRGKNEFFLKKWEKFYNLNWDFGNFHFFSFKCNGKKICVKFSFIPCSYFGILNNFLIRIINFLWKIAKIS